MFQYTLQWKTWNINLPTVDAWMKTNIGENYLGNGADYGLNLYFTTQPDDTTLASIQAYWDGIDPSSDASIQYLSAQALATAIQEQKLACLGKSWDTLTQAQQKLILGLPVTRTDLGL